MRIDADCAVKQWAEFGYFFNLVPRASFLLTSCRKTTALGQPFQACVLDADCAVNRITRIGYLLFRNGVAPRALIFRPLVKENKLKLWERDCYFLCYFEMVA